MPKGSVQTALGDEGAGAGLVLVPGRRQLLSDQLYGQILDQIVSGRLNEGDRLPPEKEICEMFEVSRPVVRDALLQLRSDGLVQARQGSGTYVQRRPADRLSKFAKTADLARHVRCMEVRMPLEAAAARFAAERRTSSQLAKIEEVHAHLEKDAEAGHITPANDSAFHMAIANATGNESFSNILQSIQDSIASFMEVTSHLTRTGSHERLLQVLSEHTIILEAIRSQEPEAAKVAMLFHFERTRRRITDRTQDM